MNCEALINQFLFDYHTGALSAPRRLEFELHLILCRDCRHYVDSYRKTISLAKNAAAQEEPVPPQLVEAILKITHDIPPKP